VVHPNPGHAKIESICVPLKNFIKKFTYS